MYTLLHAATLFEISSLGNVFGMCTNEKTRFDQVTYCSTVPYYPDFDFEFG